MQPTGLISLIFRHPWIDVKTLEIIYGQRIRGCLAREGDRLVGIDLPGAGRCIGTPGMPQILLASFWRLYMVRRFVLETMGNFVFQKGLTPGPVADGEFRYRGRWLRIWADVGGCAPEMLSLFCHPPREFGAQVQDVVLTVDERRISLLGALLENTWKGSSAVEVRTFGSSRGQMAYPRGRGGQVWTGYRTQEVLSFLKTRGRLPESVRVLEKLAAQLSPHEWDTLIYIGNNPLLGRQELESLLSERLCDTLPVKRRLTHLIGMDLLEALTQDGCARMVPSWKALALLALFWGCDEADMQRRLPWPLRRDPGGRLIYSLRWSDRLAVHTRILRQFALAVVEGSRRISGAARGMEAELVTLIGSRLLFAKSACKMPDRTGWVTPDGVLEIAFWKRVWQDGQFGPKRETTRWEVLVEIDRGTNSIPRLEERLDDYGRIWGDLRKSREVALVWVIDGTPWRERQILEKMSARGLTGWTVTLDRLITDRKDPWWQNVPSAPSGFSYDAIGGMAPMRRIWRSTEDRKYHPFLGQSLNGTVQTPRVENEREGVSP